MSGSGEGGPPVRATGRSAARPGADPRRWPWWAQVLAVHGVARLVSAAILVLVARTQEENPWTSAAPGYLEYVGLMWDATWYREIAERGYPAELPLGTDGRVRQNAWAFFPLFPLTVRALTTVSGGPWTVVAPLLATALGAAAMLMVHRTVAEAVDRGEGGPSGRAVGLVTVALLTTSVASPVLQTAYTESLALLLVAAALWSLGRGDYLLAAPLVLAVGLTRAVALPLGVAVLVHLVRLWRGGARRAELAPVVGLGAVTGLAGLLWPVLVGLRTGVPDAYTRTQAAWRGAGEVVPLRPWVDVAQWLLGSWGLPVLVALVVGAVVVVLSAPVRRLGVELQGWLGGYLAYLLVVVEPGTSLLRFGLLAFPLAGGLAVLVLRRPTPAGRRALLAGLLAAGVLAQIMWVALLWRLVPPSGWPP